VVLATIPERYDVYRQDSGEFEIFRGNEQVGATDGWNRMLDFFRSRLDDAAIPASTLVGLHLGRLGYAELALSSMAELS